MNVAQICKHLRKVSFIETSGFIHDKGRVYFVEKFPFYFRFTTRTSRYIEHSTCVDYNRPSYTHSQRIKMRHFHVLEAARYKLDLASMKEIYS